VYITLKRAGSKELAKYLRTVVLPIPGSPVISPIPLDFLR